ncbi:MAG: cytochrome c3 family protein [Gemmatimonadaceae bacterium]
MTAGRRWIVHGLVVALATAALVAWTPGRQSPRRRAMPRPSTPMELDCTGCHPGVHATMTGKGAEASARCATCHVRAHEATEALFQGMGPDTTLQPDRMFVARVGCRSCHTDASLRDTAAGPRLDAIGRACTGCHGARYRDMLTRWHDGLTWRAQVAAAYVSAAEADRRLAARPGAQADLRSASADVTLVIRGGGVHNVLGSDALLRSAIRNVASAYRVARLSAPRPPVLGPDPGAVSCAYCHYGIEAVDATMFGQTFSHADHVVRADVACSQCHSSADYFAAGGRQLNPGHGKTTVTAAACSACHHVTLALACTACHRQQDLASRTDSVTLPLHLRPAGAPSSRWVAFRHGAHSAVDCTRCHASRAAITTVVVCATCHEAHHRQAVDCSACHSTTLLASHTAAEHMVCAQCHAPGTLALLTGDRTFCVSCHVDRRNHQPSRECAPCHMQMSPDEVQARILGREP